MHRRDLEPGHEQRVAPDVKPLRQEIEIRRLADRYISSAKMGHPERTQAGPAGNRLPPPIEKHPDRPPDIGQDGLHHRETARRAGSGRYRHDDLVDAAPPLDQRRKRRMRDGRGRARSGDREHPGLLRRSVERLGETGDIVAAVGEVDIVRAVPDHRQSKAVIAALKRAGGIHHEPGRDFGQRFWPRPIKRPRGDLWPQHRLPEATTAGFPEAPFAVPQAPVPRRAASPASSPVGCRTCPMHQPGERAASPRVRRDFVYETGPHMRGWYHAGIPLSEQAIAVAGDKPIECIAHETGQDAQRAQPPPRSRQTSEHRDHRVARLAGTAVIEEEKGRRIVGIDPEACGQMAPIGGTGIEVNRIAPARSIRRISCTCAEQKLHRPSNTIRASGPGSSPWAIVRTTGLLLCPIFSTALNGFLPPPFRPSKQVAPRRSRRHCRLRRCAAAAQTRAAGICILRRPVLHSAMARDTHALRTAIDALLFTLFFIVTTLIAIVFGIGWYMSPLALGFADWPADPVTREWAERAYHFSYFAGIPMLIAGQVASVVLNARGMYRAAYLVPLGVDPALRRQRCGSPASSAMRVDSPLSDDGETWFSATTSLATARP
jgi:hypothetical protein